MAEFKFREIEETQVNDSQNVKTSGFSFREIEDTTDYTKLKANEIFSIDGSNTDAPNKLNKVNKSWMQKFYDSDIAKFGETQSKAVVRGLYETAGGVGSLISWYGDNMIMPKGAFGLEDKTIDRLNTFGRGWQKFGQIIKDGSEFVLNDEGLKLDEEIFDKDIISNPSLTRVSAAVMSAAPSLMSMVGITKATGSTALSYFLMGGVDSSDIYDAAKEKGYDMEKTNLLYTSSMAGTALIDKMLSPVEKILGGKATTVGKKIANRVVSGLSEGFAEGSQTVWQNFVTQYGIDDAQNLMEGVFEAIIGGFGAGAVASGMFEQTSTKLKEKGATQEEIDNIVNIAGDYVSKNADEINGIAFQTLDKGIGELNKFIEAHKGTPEAEKAIQTKKELDEVYNNVYTELEKLGAKEVADSQAKVIQGITLWGSQATGMSPMEYYNKRMPKVQAMDYQEFVKKYQTNVVSDALKVDARKEGIALLQADLDKLKSGKYGNNEAKKVSLSQFLKSKGGIKESGGELKNIGANKQVVGLVNNKSGMTLDEATHLAWENGYIQSTERPEINTLLDLLSDDVSGTHKVYTLKDSVNNDSEVRYFEELSRALSEANVDINKDNAEVAFDKLEAYSKKLQEAEIDRQVEALDEDMQERFYMMVENGVSKADAYNSLQPEYEDFIPFQESLDVAKQNAELDKVNPKYEGETININGVEKTVYNSNGDRIAMSEPALQNFYKWFGDSKVVDEQGRPLVVYHGSPATDIQVFDKSKIGLRDYGYFGKGFYFTPNSEMASFYYTDNYDGADYDSGKVYPVYLNLQNPKYARSIDEGTIDTEELKEQGYDGVIVYSFNEYSESVRESDPYVKQEIEEAKNFTNEWWQLKNYEDEVIGKKIIDEIVAFEPNQIKSTSNRGTYSESDNIYYQSNLSSKTRVKAREVKNALQEIANGAEEATVKDLRNDLDQYGGTNDVTFVYGDAKKGLFHIADKHGGMKTLLKVLDAVVDGNVARYSNTKKTVVVEKDGYEAVLSLDENGNKKTWLLTGWNTKISPDAEREFSATLKATQQEPTFSRQLLGAGLNDISITPNSEKVNSKVQFQSAFAGSRVDYDRPSLEAIGSGEGAQAHGWGLYYALSKDVAESYRKAFYDVISHNVAEKVKELGKNGAIEFYKQEAQKAEQRAKIFENEVPVLAQKAYEDVKAYNQMAEMAKTEGKGQVHEVDIPENPYLLDEDLYFRHQSEFVQSKIKELVEKEGLTDKFEIYQSKENPRYNILENSSGKEIYEIISEALGSYKDASLLLEKYGIKGITYMGRQDGRCFVIFNPDDVKVIQKFYQGEQSAPRGAFIENLDGKGVIFLFEKADASTFMHETAHFFRKELREFGDAKSLKMLNKVEQWENQEFDSRYNVEYVDGKYNVTDKHGDNVYTGFNSISQAREYGRNEIFARGFEAYLREGKAPNNYLKQAFRNFWSWLRSLVKTAKDLKVELNDDIKSVYAEILGGEDLDFYLSSSPDEFIQKRTATEIERVSLIEEAISKSQANKVKKGRFDNVFKEKTESAKDRNKWWKNAMIPLSTRAKRVNQGLKNKLRAYDYRTYTKLNEYLARVQPFIEKWATFEENDAIAFDLALKNGYIEKQVEIVNKYNAYDEYVQMKDLLNFIFDEAIKVNIELGYTADYFPRQIEDVDGFMSYIYGSAMASQMRRAIKEAGLEGESAEIRAEFVNKYLRGFNRIDLNKPLIGNTKDRTIDIITYDLNKYYKPSMQALFSYIEGMNNSIESRKYFGFDMENIDQSIGAYVDDLIVKGLIKPEDDTEVRAILKARFNAKGVTNKYLKTMKNMSYIYTMGGINSAITQIDDLSVAIYKAGFWNTVNSIFSKNKEGLTREDLGLERIGQEFVEASTSSKAVSEVFKLTGLDKIDAFGKNTLINATFDKFQKLANENPKQLEELIAPVMENETKQTIEDIKNGVISDNVKLLMFNELADVQPIALSEMPEYYLTSGNGRVFYMLKTFMVRRIDIFRNECFDKIRKGEVKEGVQNLFKLSVLMILMGMTKDRIIDLIFGREFDLSDAVVNNILGLVGMSKYSLYKARNEGASGLISSMAVPPLFAPLSDLSIDLYKSLFSKKGKDISDYEVWKGIPLFGRFYYWWLGGGRTKIEKKSKKKLK